MFNNEVIENYDPNSSFGKHQVKLVFKMWEYEYSTTVEVNGNCQGLTILKAALDNFIFGLAFEDECATLFFKNGEDELEVTLYEEDYEDVLENALVSATILSFEKETNENL